MLEANSKVEGTQAGKRKEAEEHFWVTSIQVHKLKEDFILSTQATNWSSFESKNSYLVRTTKDRLYPKRGHIESMFLKETKKEDVFADHSNKFGNLKDCSDT